MFNRYNGVSWTITAIHLWSTLITGQVWHTSHILYGLQTSFSGKSSIRIASSSQYKPYGISPVPRLSSPLSSFLRWQALFTPPLRADPLEVSVLPSVALFCNGISHHCCLNLKSHASPTKMIVLSGGYLCEWTLIFGHIFVIDSGRMPFVPSLLLCFSSQVHVRHCRYFNVFYVAF